ncbi:hypothetical protein ACFX16_027877 [Malus domestica]
MRDDKRNKSRRGGEERKHMRRRAKCYIAQKHILSSPASVEQTKWANLPPELLLDIVQRVEASETSWPARRDVIACVSVCKSWREIMKGIVKIPEQYGWLTFPISLHTDQGLHGPHTDPTRTKPFSEDQTFKIGTFAETSQTSSTSTTTMKNVDQYYSFGFSFIIAVVIGAEEGGFF